MGLKRNWNKNLVYKRKNELILIDDYIHINASITIPTPVKVSFNYNCDKTHIRRVLIKDINDKYKCKIHGSAFQEFSDNMLRELLIFKEHYYIIELYQSKYKGSF